MDDELKQILRDIRDLLLRIEARAEATTAQNARDERRRLIWGAIILITLILGATYSAYIFGSRVMAPRYEAPDTELNAR